MPSSPFFKKINRLSVGICLFALAAQAPFALAESVEASLKDSGDQFLFPLHGTSSQTTRPQAADSGSVEDGSDENAGSVIQGTGKATITNSAGDSETVSENPNSPSGNVVRGKNGQVIGYVDSQSSPGQNRINDADGNMLGTISKDNQQGGYQIVDQYGKPLGSIDSEGEVYNFYGQGIGTVPPGGSAADLFAAWSLIKQR